jgi:hypothetical protein
MLQVADSYDTHSRLDTRTSRYAALVNRESLCRLSSAEIVAGGRQQPIGDRVDGREAGLADHSTISRSLAKARKAKA